MALQTVYATSPAAAVEGMVANSELANIVSREVETAAGIGFGKVAIRGTGDHQVKVSAASGKFLGITVLDTTLEADLYPQYATAAVMTRGVIWVSVSVAVAAGDVAYFVPATGLFTNVVGANTAVPNGVFDTTAAAGALCRLRFSAA